jgi:hypothetical protein
MDSQIPFPPERGERIPPAAPAYIRALENRVAVLEATVQEVREQGQQTSRTSSRPPSSDPPPSLGPTAAAGPYRASAGWTAWPYRAGPGVVAGGGGGRRRPPQAGARSRLSAPVVGGRSSAPAAAGDRDSSRAPSRDRVSVAPLGLSGLRRGDLRGRARGGAAGGIRPAGPGDHRPVHRRLSSVETAHAACPGGPVRCPAGTGDHGHLGAGDGAGGGHSRDRGPHLCPTAIGRLPG